MLSNVNFSQGWFGCWIWLGDRTNGGYGKFRYHKNDTTTAHRAAYELAFGVQLPRTLVADHKCKVTDCVNPLHLEAVTQAENLLRGNTVNAINKAKTRCANGHPYNTINTHVDKLGKRHCRVCDRERKANVRSRRG